MAERHTCLPLGPASLQAPEDDEPDRRYTPVTPQRPDGISYLTQRLIADIDGVRLSAEPATLPNSPEPVDPWYAISGRHPWAQTSTLAACRVDQDRLRRHAALSGTIVGTAVACAPDNSWFEEALLIGGLDDDQAVDLARRAGQLAAIRWQRGHITLLPTGRFRGDDALTVPVLLREAPRTCPLRDDERSGLQCRRWGGPWVSASMLAASLFGMHWRLAVELLGCDACSGGREHREIPPDTDEPWDECVVASRHGGLCLPSSTTRREADAHARPPKRLR